MADQSRLQQQLTLLQQRDYEREQQLSRLRRQTTNVQDETERMKRRINRMKRRINSLHNDHESLRNDYEKTKRRINSLHNDHENNKRRLGRVEESLMDVRQLAVNVDHALLICLGGTELRSTVEYCTQYRIPENRALNKIAYAIQYLKGDRTAHDARPRDAYRCLKNAFANGYTHQQYADTTRGLGTYEYARTSSMVVWVTRMENIHFGAQLSDRIVS